MTADGELEAEVVAGNVDAFAALYLKHKKQVSWKVWKILHEHYPEDIEDVVQESFMRAFASMSTYRGGSFAGWVGRIAVFASLEIVRQEHTNVLSGDSSMPLEYEDFDGNIVQYPVRYQGRDVERSEAGFDLAKVSSGMKLHEWKLLTDRYIEGLEMKDIASRDNVTYHSVRQKANYYFKKAQSVAKNQAVSIR